MLISCPECGHSISDKAIFCPHCGYPMEQRASERLSLVSTISEIIGNSRVSQEDASLSAEFKYKTVKDLYEHSLKVPKNMGVKHLLKWTVHKLYRSGITPKDFQSAGIKGIIQPGYKMKYNNQWLELLDVSDEHLVNTFDDEEYLVPDNLDVVISKRRILAHDSNKTDLDENNIQIIECGDFYNVDPDGSY